MFITTFSIILIGLCTKYSHSSFLELSDNFSELRKDGGYWLIKFYAPWCGHCQRLEPLWAEVGDALSKTNIRVGRIDCSRFPSIASEFGIRGYPTIKFITSDSEFPFNGDRNKDEIIQFAARVSGPPVQMISSSKDLSYIKSMDYLFFIYIGDLRGDLWDVFYDVSKRFRVHAHFYAVNANIAKETEDVAQVPAVYVYKENKADIFAAMDETQGHDLANLNISLSVWVNQERFDAFQKVTHGNLNDLIQLNRYIVLVVVDEKKINGNPDMLYLRNMMKDLVKLNKVKYDRTFVFGWIGSPELANSIALKVVPLPYMMVLNSTNHQYHIPETECSKMTAEDVEIFLEKIYTQSIPAYGGNSFGVRLYRAYFEAKTAVIEMWRGNPVLTSVLFAIPVLFLSFIFYSLCFADILETEDEEEYDDDDDDDDEPHLKKE